MPAAPELEAALAAFDRGDYFAAHEGLERCWLTAQGPEREVLQGVLQVAVGLHHATRDNAHGARTLLARAQARLAGADAPWHGVDLARLLLEVAAFLARLERDGVAAARAALPLTLPRAP